MGYVLSYVLSLTNLSKYDIVNLSSLLKYT